MRSQTIYQLFMLLAAALISSTGYSQKGLADSVITKELLQQYVQALAHDSMQGRYTGTRGCEKAADWVAREMIKIDLNSLDGGNSNFHHSYYIASGRDTIRAANIVGKIAGKISDRYILFTAHYDHVGDANEQVLPQQVESSGSDKIYNGANDNASGVAALLALASYFKLLPQNSYTLLFVAFSGEEMGNVGSNIFVESFRDLKNIHQVINLEMLGRFSNNRKKPFVTEGINSYGLTRKLNRNLRQKDSTVTKVFFQYDKLPLENYFFRSDNFSFATKGVPANSIMASSDSDSFYHTPSDESQTLDYEAMTRLVKAIALACTPLVR